MRESRLFKIFLPLLIFFCVVPLLFYALGSGEPFFSASVGGGMAALAILASIVPVMITIDKRRDIFFFVFLGMIPVRLFLICGILALLLWLELIRPFPAAISLFAFYIFFMTFEIVMFWSLQRNQEG